MTSCRAVTHPRHDETLYSMAARASRYLGSPQRGLFHEAVFGIDVPVFADMPNGLERVVASGAFGPADLGHAVHEWTLFPYYAQHVAPGRARVAAEAMATTGRWPHEPLGGVSSSASPPERLRFCLSCCEDMLDQCADLWWRRAHQLPSVLFCPEHGEPLRESSVGREERRRGYVPATIEICSPTALPVVGELDRRTRDDLLDLARRSDALLDLACNTHPDDRREHYLGRLQRLGLLNRAGEAKLPAIAIAVDRYWREALSLWPGLTRDGCCAQGWLGSLLLGQHGSPPLHHLLLECVLTPRPRRW